MKPHLLSILMAASAFSLTPAFAAPTAELPAPVSPTGAFEQDTNKPSAITWKAQEVTQKVGADDTKIEFTFEGVNNQNTEITIPYVRLSCGCQDVKLNKTSFKAGEVIILTGSMTFKAGTGTYTRPLNVYTDKGGPSTLTVTALGPEGLSVAPTTLTWSPGDKAPKTVTITAAKADQIQKIDLLGGGFRHDIKTAGLVTTISVTPNGKTGDRAALRITQAGSVRPNYVALSYGESPRPPVPEKAPTPSPAPAPTPTPTQPSVGAAPTQPAAAPSNAQNPSYEQMKQDLEETRVLLRAALRRLDQYN